MAITAPGFAQTEEFSMPDAATYSPSVAPTRITPEEAPKIDGILDDAVWEKAAVISEFYAVEPHVGKPTEDTFVYFAYDENALYVAVRALDSEPDKIQSRIMTRDGDVWRDDMLRFYIDPFNTGLGGFAFDVNAIGARLDRIIRDGGMPIVAWDAIWNAQGQITDEGWSAEMIIPFRSISFDPGSEEGWGLLVTREIARKNEQVRWANIQPGTRPFDFRQPGRLVGIRDIEQGMGLDVEVLGTVTASRDWTNPRDDDLTVQPSGNIYYKFTPSLTGLLTLNSDFSDTPLDSRQINTGRFSIFQPETRDFFLQDANLFEFAGETFGGSPNGRPFFSRRIGIVNGQQVDLKAGVKLSGEYNGVEVGMLSARMGSTDTIDAQTLSVARVSMDVLDNSRLGVIATNGDPTGATENTLVGTDFIYRDNQFMGGGLFQATLFYQMAMSSLGDDDSYGVMLDYPNDKWGWNVAVREVGKDFRPALGFVNRPGIREYKGRWHRRFRPSDGWIQTWQYGTHHNYTTGLDDRLQSRSNSLNFRLTNRQSDEFELRLAEEYENVQSLFFLPKSVPVTVGEYSNDGVFARVRSSFARPYGTNSEIEYQKYFGGDRLRMKLNANYRPSRFTTIQVEYEHDNISVPSGDVTVQIYSVENILNFSPRVSVNTQVQYDNISEGFSLFSRMRWEVRPETEVFLSFGHGAIIDYDTFPRDFESVQSQFVLRFGNRFQF
ncbi:MAG: hypothetical protein CMK07_05305 [Ponticaulis sp.]|nr:hypothetical protein [Ponticaulis sp.]